MVAVDGLNTWIIPLTEMSEERLEISLRENRGLNTGDYVYT